METVKELDMETVKMQKTNPEDGPSEADVNVKEITNYEAAGWHIAKPSKEKKAK